MLGLIRSAPVGAVIEIARLNIADIVHLGDQAGPVRDALSEPEAVEPVQIGGAGNGPVGRLRHVSGILEIRKGQRFFPSIDLDYD